MSAPTVTEADRALITEIAHAKPTSPLPEMGLEAAIERLIALRIMSRPNDGTDMGTVTASAQRACRVYLGGEFGPGL